MLSTTSTVFVPGWRWIARTTRAFVLVPVRHLVVFYTVDNPAQFLKSHRRAVPGRPQSEDDRLRHYRADRWPEW